MNNFDVYGFLYENILNEFDMNPQDQQQQANPGGEQGSPVQQQQQQQPQSPSQNAFADIKGKVVKSINFKKLGPNAGQIEIVLADFDIPLVISWVNDRVTASKPPTGEPVALT